VTGAGALLALALAALPAGRASYRMELGGEPTGVVTLELRPEGAGRAVTWVSTQRLPAEAGGGLLQRRVELHVDAEGRAVGPARIAEGGAAREVALPAGAVPALLVEAVLAARLEDGASACVEAVEELSGAPFRACARRDGGWWRLELGPERESVRPGADGLAEEVVLPGQRTRFVRDAGASVPERPPRLFGVEVDGPAEPGRGARFCGVPRDRRAAAVPAALPAPRAEGASCREQAAAWLRSARAAGWRGRTAVGVAWSGAAWSWHAWAEVRVGAAWVPVDPSFGQAPASSPRFTLASWEDGDEADRAEAGRRILACWGRARVEP
jgi:hypothetical protein